MSEFFAALASLGPVGVLAAGFVALVAWVAVVSAKAGRQYERVHSRLDALDHHEQGRVPKVEKRVDELEEAYVTQDKKLDVLINDTKWIRGALDGRKRRADA